MIATAATIEGEMRMEVSARALHSLHRLWSLILGTPDSIEGALGESSKLAMGI